MLKSLRNVARKQAAFDGKQKIPNENPDAEIILVLGISLALGCWSLEFLTPPAHA
jgi:hypothetical protein